MENKEYKEKLIDFYITDFSDTSEKLETLDKKIQYFIQIFGLVTSVIITAFLSFVEVETNSLTTAFLLCLSFTLIVIMGEFIFCANVSGLRTHNIYINRLNELRRRILKELGKSDIEIREYKFTEKMPIGRSGMTYLMIIFMVIFLCFIIMLDCVCFYKLLLIILNVSECVAFGISVTTCIITCLSTIFFNIIKIEDVIKKSIQSAPQEINNEVTTEINIQS